MFGCSRIKLLLSLEIDSNLKSDFVAFFFRIDFFSFCIYQTTYFYINVYKHISFYLQFTFSQNQIYIINFCHRRIKHTLSYLVFLLRYYKYFLFFLGTQLFLCKIRMCYELYGTPFKMIIEMSKIFLQGDISFVKLLKQSTLCIPPYFSKFSKDVFFIISIMKNKF